MNKLLFIFNFTYAYEISAQSIRKKSFQKVETVPLSLLSITDNACFAFSLQRDSHFKPCHVYMTRLIHRI